MPQSQRKPSNNNDEQVLVYVVRHGTTRLNQAGCFRGPLDVPLDDEGIRAAHEAAQFLAERAAYPAIFHSAKKRTTQTAQIIAGLRPGAKLIENAGLNALNVGNLGGQKKTPETDAIVLAHVQNPDEPFVGGESLNHFRNRVRPLLQEAIKAALCNTVTGKTPVPVILVAHSSVVREVGQCLHPEHPESVLVEPGGIAGIFLANGHLIAHPILKPDVGNERKSFIVS